MPDPIDRTEIIRLSVQRTREDILTAVQEKDWEALGETYDEWRASILEGLPDEVREVLPEVYRDEPVIQRVLLGE
jgi:hypothetical protein